MPRVWAGRASCAFSVGFSSKQVYLIMIMIIIITTRVRRTASSAQPSPSVRPCIFACAMKTCKPYILLRLTKIFRRVILYYVADVLSLRNFFKGFTLARNDKLGTVATTVTRANGVLVVRYHNTDIVTYDEKTTRVTLRTGGYDTVTTRLRMNQASAQFDLKFKVKRVKGETLVTVGGRHLPLENFIWFELNAWTGLV